MSKRDPATEQSILTLISLVIKLEARMSAEMEAVTAALNDLASSVQGLLTHHNSIPAPVATSGDLSAVVAQINGIKAAVDAALAQPAGGAAAAPVPSPGV